jgi:hypothetical protein
MASSGSERGRTGLSGVSHDEPRTAPARPRSSSARAMDGRCLRPGGANVNRAVEAPMMRRLSSAPAITPNAWRTSSGSSSLRGLT